jgi:hypothetical protein
MNYAILVFSQSKGIQELVLVFKQEDKYAAQIMEKIIGSIELRKTAE